MNIMAFFEPVGRFFFQQNRVLLFFCLLIAPFFLILALLAPRFFALRETEQTFDAAALRGRSALEKRLEKEQFIQRYSHFEPYFVDQCLEALPLLQKNLKDLQAMKNHPACKDRRGKHPLVQTRQGNRGASAASGGNRRQRFGTSALSDRRCPDRRIYSGTSLASTDYSGLYPEKKRRCRLRTKPFSDQTGILPCL
jgi:hypothetical protein